MKNYKQILEAINKGIQLALDDFDEKDSNELIIPKKDVIKNNNSVKELLDFYDSFVDLGLPSGTLWCKYNLGVDPKNLHKPYDWYGKYFAWGEITEKDWYNWLNYDWAYMQQNKATKYCDNPSFGYDGFADYQMNLKPEDDIATVTYGPGYHIPTSVQIDELIDNTDYEMVKNFENTGVNGLICRSKVNDNYIFLPMAGYKSDIDKENKHNGNSKCKWHCIGQHCEIWASDYYQTGTPAYANVLSVNIQFINRAPKDYGLAVYQTSRCHGIPVRPVYNP